eukprot:gene8359-biopygen1591
MGGWVARGGGNFGISRGASRRANPRLAPRVRPHPPRGPGARRGADGTGSWSSVSTTVWDDTFPDSWRPVGGNGGGILSLPSGPARAQSGRANDTDDLWE